MVDCCDPATKGPTPYQVDADPPFWVETQTRLYIVHGLAVAKISRINAAAIQFASE